MDTFKGWLRPLAKHVMGADPAAAAGVAREAPRGFPPGKVMFRPHPFWQRIREEHIAPGGIEFNMGMDGGGTFGRLKTKRVMEPDSEFAKTVTRIVPDDKGKGDTECLSAMLREAAGAGDIDELMSLIQSCWVVRAAVEPAVCEACLQNQPDALRFLLDAGAPASAVFSRKPALFFAVENSAEVCAKHLIDDLDPEDVYAVDAYGKTVFDVAEALDLKPLATRLLAYAEEDASAAPAPWVRGKGVAMPGSVAGSVCTSLQYPGDQSIASSAALERIKELEEKLQREKLLRRQLQKRIEKEVEGEETGSVRLPPSEASWVSMPSVSSRSRRSASTASKQLTADNLKKVTSMQGGVKALLRSKREEASASRGATMKLIQPDPRGGQHSPYSDTPPPLYPVSTDKRKVVTKPPIYRGGIAKPKANFHPRKRGEHYDEWMHGQRAGGNELRFLFRDNWA